MPRDAKTDLDEEEVAGESGESLVPVGQPTPRFDVIARLLARHRQSTHSFFPHLSDDERTQFERIASIILERPGEVWLDLGCGTGESTLRLAETHPQRLVVGVDKSSHRLSKASTSLPGNCVYLRADAHRLLAALDRAQCRVEKTWIIYPNPWPKPQHLQRRWYAHDAFVRLLRMTAQLECRTNWSVYAHEMAFALTASQRQVQGPVSWLPQVPLSAFERKYLASGHELWRIMAC